jgi:hypothetical protein
MDCCGDSFTLLYFTLLCFALLYFTLLYFTLLYFTLLYFTLLHFTSLHFTSLHFTLLYFTSLHFTSLHFTSLHFTSLHFTSLHFTSLHFTSLYFTLLYFTLLYFKSPLSLSSSDDVDRCSRWNVAYSSHADANNCAAICTAFRGCQSFKSCNNRLIKLAIDPYRNIVVPVSKLIRVLPFCFQGEEEIGVADGGDWSSTVGWLITHSAVASACLLVRILCSSTVGWLITHSAVASACLLVRILCSSTSLRTQPFMSGSYKRDGMRTSLYFYLSDGTNSSCF